MVQYLSKTLVQGFIILFAAAAAMVLVKINLSDGYEWQISRSSIFVFILLNQFQGFRSDDWLNYSMMSLFILLALSVDLIILSTLFSGIRIQEVQHSLAWFFLPLLSFPVAILLFRLVKMIGTNRPS